MSCRYCYGQTASIHESTLYVSKTIGPTITLITSAAHIAIDSLSKQYGIPIGGKSTPYSFTISTNIVPSIAVDNIDVELGGNFEFENIIDFRDALAGRKILGLENHPKNLAKLSDNKDALVKYFMELYKMPLDIIAAYGTNASSHNDVKNTDISKYKLNLSLISTGNKYPGVIQAVKDVFIRNQKSLNYKAEFITNSKSNVDINATHKIIISIEDDKINEQVIVSLKFDKNTNLLYSGDPIRTEFIVDKSDIQHGDYSFLVARMTATLQKFKESNLK